MATRFAARWSATSRPTPSRRSRDRAQLRTLLVLTVARPLLSAATKAAAGWLFRTDDEGFQARLAADPRADGAAVPVTMTATSDEGPGPIKV